ncbi:MAG: permease, partial [Muribaculaceae bacterium]|nr:permease [Muribaculaceae bacterium]
MITEFLATFWAMLCEMAPYLLLGFLFAGMLHAFLPASFYNRHLGRPGFWSVAKAAMFGVPLPLCSCGVIPTAMSMRRQGASRAATVSFLISTPQTGVDSILATGSLLGWPLALIRPIAAFATALA